MSTPQYGEPPKVPSRMVVSAVPVCPHCKHKRLDRVIEEHLSHLKHGSVAHMTCQACHRHFKIQVLGSYEIKARAYRTVPSEIDFPKLPEEMVK